MSKLLLILLIININIINSYEKEYEIHPGISRKYFIKYEETSFKLNIPENSDLQINIHSINCYIDITPEKNIIDHINFNKYSLKVNSTNKNIFITPLKDIIKGEDKENYEIKFCPLIINSYYISKQSEQELNDILNIENNEQNIFYLNPLIYNESLKISYYIKNITINSFVSLNFNFKDAPFLINISYINNKNENNSMIKTINNSSYIFLNSDFLLYDINNNNISGKLFIEIYNIKYKEIYLSLKIIEENSICLLEKNALNFGFITSNSTYHYYYTEILPGEEGELMLHNKRLYGVLHAKIINKSDIDINELNNINLYLHNETKLEYNQHSLQLKFDYDDTVLCFDGCYLLVTYEQIKSEGDFPLIGYEYTILSRTWNYIDYISDSIEIPYNEYIISCFGKGASREHYYSIYIPEEADKILIQIEGNYFDAFYEKGKKIINTLNDRTKKIEIKDNKDVFILQRDKDYNSKDKLIGLAFRPKDYNKEIISFYYFRVLYKEKLKEKYLPIDSNFGNLCVPEFNFCYLILKNDYNELNNNKFVISSSNQNEYVKINISIIYKNKTKFDDAYNIKYIFNENIKNINEIDYILFKFEFTNNELKNIISAFSDKIENIYLQIYSIQTFYLDNFDKTYYFKLNNDYKGNYQYISGKPGNINNYLSSIISKGKFSIFPILNNDNITISTKHNGFIYYIQLINDMKNKGIEELKHNSPLIHLIKEPFFPLFYYYKLKNKNYINININIKVHNKSLSNNYKSNIYIINEDTLERKKAGEYVPFPTAILSNDSEAFELSFLEVNKELENNETHLLISVNTKKKINIKLNIFVVELLVKDYEENNKLFLPKNEYIIETFNATNNTIRKLNQYYIPKPENNLNQVIIELSTNYLETKINFRKDIIYNSFNAAGFQKFIINQSDLNIIEFNVTNNKLNNKANYMIRYYINETNNEPEFFFDEKYKIDFANSSDNKFTNISLMFNSIKIKLEGNLLSEENIDFYITGALFKKNNDSNLNELINTTCFLQERKPSYNNQTFFAYNETNKNEWSLQFNNISRNNNYIYELQIKVDAVIKSYFQEEFMVYVTQVDLTGIKLEETNKKNSWLPWGIPLIIVVAAVLVFFIIKLVKLKKKNDSLQLEMKSLAFSNDIQTNVLIKEKNISKNESDYESTFI